MLRFFFYARAAAGKVLRWVVCLLLRVCVKSDATAQLRRQLSVWRYSLLFCVLRGAAIAAKALQDCACCWMPSVLQDASSVRLVGFGFQGPRYLVAAKIVCRRVLAARGDVKPPRLARIFTF